jgi:hypothetical protein
LQILKSIKNKLVTVKTQRPKALSTEKAFLNFPMPAAAFLYEYQ